MELSEIRKLRTRAGMSQTDLAKKAGVSQAHIAKIEAGKVDPRFSTIDRILRCLKEEQKETCAKYMTRTIFGVQAEDSVAAAGRLMRQREVSQIVVFRGEGVIGLITEGDLLRFKGDAEANRSEEVMSDSPPTVSKNASADSVRDLLLEFPAVVVMDGERAAGIITKSDLIRRI